MSIKIAVFDLGNVIFRFDSLKFIKAYISKIPDHKITDFNELIPTYSEFTYAYEKGNISSFDFYDMLAKKTDYIGTYNEFAVQWNNIFEPIPETIELIASLVNNYKLAILSNTNELHFCFLDEHYPQVFSLFNDFFLSYKMHLRKPEHEIFKQVIKHYNVSPAEIFFTDDVKENIKAAKINGINAHLFTGALELTKQLKDQRAQI
jgi:putative hydrolase of the HAD superfamily